MLWFVRTKLLVSKIASMLNRVVLKLSLPELMGHAYFEKLIVDFDFVYIFA